MLYYSIGDGRLLEAWTGGYCGEAMARTSTSDQRGTWITLRFPLSARRTNMSGLCSWNVLRVLECLLSMGYPILSGIAQFYGYLVLKEYLRSQECSHDNTKPWLCGLCLLYSPIEHSITLGHLDSRICRPHGGR